MADTVDDILAAYVIVKHNERKRRQRSIWVKKWLLKRNKLSHTNIMAELKVYPEDFRNFLRMDEDKYMVLLEKVKPLIEKETTMMRSPISPHERLAVTLRFLATGRSYADLKFSSCISAPALHRIIPETCSAICTSLVKDYMKFPSTPEEWLQEAKLFEGRWQFPNCLGSIDGKHVAIRPPPGSGSFYFNYKGFHSVVLMAIANANYEFLYVNVGTNGRVSDGGVIENTDFHRRLIGGGLNLPAVNQANGLPYVFITDEAFALREDCLKPYNIKLLDDEKRVFNYRLSRARRVVENVFGILVSRFGVLQSEIKLQPQYVDTVVLAYCALHNFLIKESPGNYTPAGSVDSEDPETHEIQPGLSVGGTNIAPVSKVQARNAPDEAKQVRDRFKDYFNNDGSVDWQYEHLYG